MFSKAAPDLNDERDGSSRCDTMSDAEEVLKKLTEDEKAEMLELLLLEMTPDGVKRWAIEGPRCQSLIGWFVPLGPFVEEYEKEHPEVGYSGDESDLID